MHYKIGGNIGKYQLFGALHQKKEVEGLKSQINLWNTGLQGDKSLGRVMEENKKGGNIGGTHSADAGCLSEIERTDAIQFFASLLR